jgi:hypothetical protein
MRSEIRPPLPDLWSTGSRHRSAVIEGISGSHQLDRFSCGAAAVATVVRAYSGCLDADAWFTTLRYTNPRPCDGTPTWRLRQALHELGFESSLSRTFNAGSVSEMIRRGDLIITTVRMPRQPPDATHWVVVAGCSPEEVLILNATGLPLFSKRWIPWEEVTTRRDHREIVIRVHTGLSDRVSDQYPATFSGRQARQGIARRM